MAQGVGLNLRQPLDRLSRKAGHSMKREAWRDPAAFVSQRSRDVTLLPSEITTIFYNSFHAFNVQARSPDLGLEASRVV
jgi:hypothetical protein